MNSKVLIVAPLNEQKSFSGQVLYSKLLCEALKRHQADIEVLDFKFKKKNSHSLLEYFNFRALWIIIKKIKEKEYTKIHFVYLPSTFTYMLFIAIYKILTFRRLKIILTLPDYFHTYYLELYRKNHKPKLLVNYLIYLTVYVLSDLLCRIHVIGTREKKYHVSSPLIVNDFKYLEREKNNAIFIPLPSKIFSSLLIEKFDIKNLPYKFTILTRDNVLIENFKNINNVKIINHIENYDEFVQKFYIHLLYDHAGTGMSNKVATAFKVNSIPIGNRVAFRGLKTFPEDFIFEYDINNKEAFINFIDNFLMMPRIKTRKIFELEYKKEIPLIYE